MLLRLDFLVYVLEIVGVPPSPPKEKEKKRKPVNIISIPWEAPHIYL
jgi:hypothetical protein